MLCQEGLEHTVIGYQYGMEKDIYLILLMPVSD